MSFSDTTQTTISPVDQQSVCVRDYPSQQTVATALDAASTASSRWANSPLGQRLAAVTRFVDLFEKEAGLTDPNAGAWTLALFSTLDHNLPTPPR